MGDWESLKAHIRDVEGFPQEGILFRDITPLLGTPQAFALAVDGLAAMAPAGVTHIAAVEARGFIFASAVAVRLGAALVPVRKPGKLPYRTVSVDYELEYGTDSLAMHTDAVDADSVVFLVDDLIATGGTLAAAAALIRKCGGKVAKIGCVIELTELNGTARLPENIAFDSLLKY